MKQSIHHLRFTRPAARFLMDNTRTPIALVLVGSILVTPATAWCHSHSGLAFGLGLLGGYGLGYYGRAPYLPYYGYPSGYGFAPWVGFGPVYGYTSPPVVMAPSPPPVYIQQQVMPPQPQAPVGYFWHYCRDPEGYYPYVSNCPDGWLRVAPQPDH